MADEKQEKTIHLRVEEVQPNPLQPRGAVTTESLTELASSIKIHGLLEPLVVAHTPAGYQIIAGERRWRAAKIAGLATVPVVVRETSPRGMLEMALVENVQREDLNPIERGKAFERLINEFGLNTNEIAQRIGKSNSYVSNTVRLLKLPDALKDGILTGLISEGHARALFGITDEKLLIETFKIILKRSLSVRGAEELARRTKTAHRIGVERKYPRQAKIVSGKIGEIEEEMTKALGEGADVKIIRSTRRTKVRIVVEGSVKKTDKILQKIYKAILGVATKPNFEGGQ